MSAIAESINQWPESRSRSWGRRIIRLLAALVLLIALLLLTGIVYQSIASAIDARRYPPPGEFVDVGGYHLYVNELGEAGDGPTVILENGGAGMSPQWGWVQPAVSEFARVVSYDRPGTGWSEASPQPLDAAELATVLHAALEKQGISGPYVVAGHSMGGLTARTFAALYPDEVVGVVLIDPRPPTLDAVFPDGSGELNFPFFRILAILNRVGLSRLMGGAQAQAEGLPSPAYEQAVVLSYSDHHVRGMTREGLLSESLAQFLSDQHTLGDRPLIVLSAGTADASFNEQARPRLTAAQEEMASLSSRGEHRLVPDATHHTIVTYQQNAQAVIEAIRDVVVSSAAVAE